MPVPDTNSVPILEFDPSAQSAGIAEENRRRFHENDVLALHLMSASGSGKTRLLEVTLDRLKERTPTAVIEGDVATANDARRVARHGVPVVQLVTREAGFLEASQVKEGLSRLPTPRSGILFIENVGNLVFPASHDLGETLRAVCVSVTEGEDRPEKYPALFARAGAMVLTKTDLLPHVDFDANRVVTRAKELNPRIRVFRTSAVTGEGLDEWCEYLLGMAHREEMALE